MSRQGRTALGEEGLNVPPSTAWNLEERLNAPPSTAWNLERGLRQYARMWSFCVGVRAVRRAAGKGDPRVSVWTMLNV